MELVAKILMVVSGSVILLLGTVHLVYTFSGPKLRPRDAELITRMNEVSPVVSRETTMWRAWLGFNASHSFGAILFGLVYCYLAISQPGVLFGSTFLLAVGFTLLVGYILLARQYWFSIPLRGIAVALAFYVGSIVASVA